MVIIKVEMTDQEANVLAQLLDVAVKAGGLQVAEAAVIFSKRIAGAIQAAQAEAAKAQVPVQPTPAAPAESTEAPAEQDNAPQQEAA